MQPQPLPNGSPPVEIKVHMIPNPGGGKLRFCASDGSYLGSIEYDAANPQALQAMANVFQNFAAQQAGGIQIASQIAGLRS